MMDSTSFFDTVTVLFEHAIIILREQPRRIFCTLQECTITITWVRKSDKNSMKVVEQTNPHSALLKTFQKIVLAHR